jgi:hypothetical protein
MSKVRRKTKSSARTRAHRAPVTLTRHEIERAGESIVAASEALARAIQANIIAIGILAAARDRADGAKT